MGLQLGVAILNELPELVLAHRPFAAVQIYRYIPSAAAIITRVAAALLTEARLQAGLDDVRQVHAVTGKVLGRDYSSLDEAGRAAYIAETGYHLRREDVDGANVLVVDDVRNTGAAEDLVFRFTADKGIENLVLAYAAVIDHAQARRNPMGERTLNVSCIKSLEDLLELVHSDDMELTIRTIKMVLGHKDHAELRDFLGQLSDQLLFELFAGTLGSGSEFVDYYADGFAIVREVARERKLLPGL
jgi:hypothetical protein